MDPLTLGILSTAGTALLGGNIFFVKRLVDKIDETGKSVQRLSEKVARMEGAMFNTHREDANEKRKH